MVLKLQCNYVTFQMLTIILGVLWSANGTMGPKFLCIQQSDGHQAGLCHVLIQDTLFVSIREIHPLPPKKNLALQKLWVGYVPTVTVQPRPLWATLHCQF